MSWFTQTVSLTQIKNADRIWLYAFGFIALLYLLIPTLIVIPMSFSDSQYLEFPPKAYSLKWFETYFGSAEWMRATFVSVRAAFFTSIFATIFGTAAAYGTWIGSAQLRTPLSGFFILPLSVPSILIAIGSLFVFSRFGLVNTTAGLVIAHTMLAIPFVFIVITAGLTSYDMNQEMAARSLGASRARAFFTVTLPQIKFSVITSALFAFYVSLDEVIVAMFISTGTGGTLNRKMFNALRDQVDPTIAAISTCMVAVSITLLVMAQIFRPKSEQR
ncbi:ABC transporter permease (plasmid) [Agrobacterium radiobacter]|uniref:ABC transporter permease n=2 Tax=Agrobacterium tumefaciens TaxID=358 RepID=Q44381_AGRTU|nr:MULTISPECIES: ABC transporter permease [Rhizobium/Agrobacterium group]AHK05201.1 mannopine permease [Agrobacterium tumefaciens LBA4213 (Ach5)]AKC10931.1 spermidine/putrescine transport system permease protein [Agrobacterium tumefaciens]AAC18648.1 motD [Agrobacterium tumefaciens]ASK41550.1 ABC transporter permease [Agrobacterium tumefaciens]ASK47155.1 ABC transporter permease [Agrobacterium radiobacter]